jgi:signal transduction histidine kinase
VLSIKTRQVAYFTLYVGVAVLLLSGWYLFSMAREMLQETGARAQLVANMTYQGARDAIATGPDPYENLRTDPGIHSILQGAASFERNLLYAVIVDGTDHVIAGDDPNPGQPLPKPPEMDALLRGGLVAQTKAIFQGETFEVRKPLELVGGTEFTVRVGVSTLLVWDEIYKSSATPFITAVLAIVGAVFVALTLAQLIVRPIHVIRSGLARLGRGELDVAVDLPRDSELNDLGDAFKAVSARLAADRSEIDQAAALESVVEHLEDAVALFAPDGALLFANPAMRRMLSAEQGSIRQVLPESHPYRLAAEDVLSGRIAEVRTTADLPDGSQRQVLVQAVEDPDHSRLGAMLVARNVGYLTQVQSKLFYSRKLAALSRLTAGIAHEVKNPLNATMIHLELLKMRVEEQPEALDHVKIITAQVRRLDEVVQGFLRFTRPEDLKFQPVALAPLVDSTMPVIRAEAEKSGVEVRLEFPSNLPPVSGDPGLLEQAFLNLGLNACQAMPNGGRLRIAASPTADGQVEILFEDSGIGITPSDLERIFDLYFTTKEHGSGIGLSLVYRTVQLHDGEIEVQSTPGRGTTFRIKLRRSP